MTNVFIIHGSYGNPGENWFPWLKGELEKLGCNVFVPKFATPKNQSLANWMKEFQQYEKYLDENTILVGHSIGCAFILNVLEKYGDLPGKKSIKASFLVSGFTGSLGDPVFDTLNNTFADRDFDWQKIRHNCGKFYVFHSDNDRYVPLSKAKMLGISLGVEPNIIKDAGHFNAASGYTKFELLLKLIKAEL
jgi:uncharacterized protein